MRIPVALSVEAVVDKVSPLHFKYLPRPTFLILK